MHVLSGLFLAQKHLLLQILMIFHHYESGVLFYLILFELLLLYFLFPKRSQFIFCHEADSFRPLNRGRSSCGFHDRRSTPIHHTTVHISRQTAVCDYTRHLHCEHFICFGLPWQAGKFFLIVTTRTDVCLKLLRC